MDEGRLIEAVLAGDQQAARRLYDRYAPAVISLAWRLLGVGDLVEECVQETFVRGFRSLSGFRSDAGLATWLHRIAVRTAADLLRRDSRSVVVGALEVRDSDATASPASADPFVRRRVVDAIAELSAPQRDVALLYFVHERTHAEIGEILGIPVGTSKRRLHEARAALAAKLGALAE